MSDENRLKRLKMRSWRRGIKEMDLILGPWADEQAVTLDDAALDVYEALLGENDHDLYQWVTARIGKGNAQPVGPGAYAGLLDRIAVHAAARLER
ncbi:FAD assembly factor SdhE [Pararhodobacter zhoushanensis]|uniref:FAD assembly factor SdhE n=1 Tax=Pararhodobacter zhoushanensis TaxID=2479545 RepID=A0ABT3H1K3_9RHOB|nr:succinate dehydrogenase assembly factor 2 [Pararhodobacter zhoushanensis]MCW1933648.1 succinate dehydrogenase assembly factor 2 [Pararhodobacter zhoushanensis]